MWLAVSGVKEQKQTGIVKPQSYFQRQLVQDRGKRIEIAVGRVARVWRVQCFLGSDESIYKIAAIYSMSLDISDSSVVLINIRLLILVLPMSFITYVLYKSIPVETEKTDDHMRECCQKLSKTLTLHRQEKAKWKVHTKKTAIMYFYDTSRSQGDITYRPCESSQAQLLNYLT